MNVSCTAVCPLIKQAHLIDKLDKYIHKFAMPTASVLLLLHPRIAVTVFSVEQMTIRESRSNLSDPNLLQGEN